MTAQKYGAGNPVPNQIEDSAVNPPQMAQNAAQSSPSSDDRQVCRIEDTQTQLLRLIDDFWGLGGVSSPVEIINDLLYRWLTTSAADLSKSANQDQLHSAMELVNFLTKLYELSTEKGGQDNA